MCGYAQFVMQKVMPAGKDNFLKFFDRFLIFVSSFFEIYPPKSELLDSIETTGCGKLLFVIIYHVLFFT